LDIRDTPNGLPARASGAFDDQLESDTGGTNEDWEALVADPARGDQIAARTREPKEGNAGAKRARRGEQRGKIRGADQAIAVGVTVTAVR
jgi:hypothetical protein